MKIVHDYSQYRALRKSAPVRKLVDDKAAELLAEAERIGRGEYGYVSGAPGGADRWRAFVETRDFRAQADQANNDTLLKALGVLSL